MSVSIIAQSGARRSVDPDTLSRALITPNMFVYPARQKTGMRIAQRIQPMGGGLAFRTIPGGVIAARQRHDTFASQVKDARYSQHC